MPERRAPWLRYSLMRVTIFAAWFLLGWLVADLLNVGSVGWFVILVVVAVASMVTSFYVLAPLRQATMEDLAGRMERRHERRDEALAANAEDEFIEE